MSYDDAKRYNDYWRNLESGKNTGYPGLTDADISAWNFGDTKLNEHIAISKIDPDEVLSIRMDALELENGLRTVDNEVSKPELNRIDYLRNKYGKLTSEQINNRINLRGATHDKLNELLQSGISRKNLAQLLQVLWIQKVGKFIMD